MPPPPYVGILSSHWLTRNARVVLIYNPKVVDLSSKHQLTSATQLRGKPVSAFAARLVVGCWKSLWVALIGPVVDDTWCSQISRFTFNDWSFAHVLPNIRLPQSFDWSSLFHAVSQFLSVFLLIFCALSFLVHERETEREREKESKWTILWG